MKRKGLSLFLSLSVTAVLAGCSPTDAAVIQEVGLQGLGKDVKGFVDQVSGDSGLFLYSSADDKSYLIVNYSSVLLGDEAQLLDAVTAEVRDKSLYIHVEGGSTADVQDTEAGKLKVYELAEAVEYETIHILDNGKETFFNKIGS